MKILISPAKQMKSYDDYFNTSSSPLFLHKTNLLLEHLKDNRLYGSDVILYDTDENTCMLTIYAILYALDYQDDYEVLVLDKKIENVGLRMKDFLIRRK